jgi:hypothetical protein
MKLTYILKSKETNLFPFGIIIAMQDIFQVITEIVMEMFLTSDAQQRNMGSLTRIHILNER